MAELRALAALHDPVPAEALLAARSAMAWLSMDAELAELAETSSASEPAGVRGPGAPLMLTFTLPDLTVELEVIEEGSRRRLVGQLVPPQPGTIAVRHGGGTLELVADEVGRFVAHGVSPGPVSLRCAISGRVVETDWFLA